MCIKSQIRSAASQSFPFNDPIDSRRVNRRISVVSGNPDCGSKRNPMATEVTMRSQNLPGQLHHFLTPHLDFHPKETVVTPGISAAFPALCLAPRSRLIRPVSQDTHRAVKLPSECLALLNTIFRQNRRKRSRMPVTEHRFFQSLC